MKKAVGIFVVVFISIGLADLMQGFILTMAYNPGLHTGNILELSPIFKYFVSASTITLVLLGAYKLRDLLRNNKKSEKIL